MTTIFPGEPIHYTGERHTWNNGFRRRWLANGEKNAGIINAARRGDFETVLTAVRQLGGVNGGVGIARSLMKLAQKMECDAPAYRLVKHGNGQVTLSIASVSWRYAGSRQTGVFEYVPMVSTR